MLTLFFMEKGSHQNFGYIWLKVFILYVKKLKKFVKIPYQSMYFIQSNIMSGFFIGVNVVY